MTARRNSGLSGYLPRYRGYQTQVDVTAAATVVGLVIKHAHNTADARDLLDKLGLLPTGDQQ